MTRNDFFSICQLSKRQGDELKIKYQEDGNHAQIVLSGYWRNVIGPVLETPVYKPRYWGVSAGERRKRLDAQFEKFQRWLEEYKSQ